MNEATQFLYELRLATLQNIEKETKTTDELYGHLKDCIHETATATMDTESEREQKPELWSQEINVNTKKKNKKLGYGHQICKTGRNICIGIKQLQKQK